MVMNKKATFFSKIFHVFPSRKRAQFFILAAVIIASIIAGLGISGNYVLSGEEQEVFYDLSEEIKYEGSRVIDYGVYNSVDVPEKISNFTEQVARSVNDRDPNIEFVVVHGDENSLTIENFAKSESVFKVGGDEVVVGGAGEGYETEIVVNVGMTFAMNSVTPLLNNPSWWRKELDISGGSKQIKIVIHSKEYVFDLRKNQQFFMVIRKEAGEEEYVDVK